MILNFSIEQIFVSIEGNIFQISDISIQLVCRVKKQLQHNFTEGNTSAGPHPRMLTQEIAENTHF